MLQHIAGFTKLSDWLNTGGEYNLFPKATSVYSQSVATFLADYQRLWQRRRARLNAIEPAIYHGFNLFSVLGSTTEFSSQGTNRDTRYLMNHDGVFVAVSQPDKR